MKIKLKIEKEYDAVTLLVDAGVRYWEDAEVDGKEDSVGDLIPCREGERWKPIIDLETGTITNWKQGVRAKIHYKVCDDGIYKLVDSEGSVLKEIDGYVIGIMSPDGEGYGDYIKMTVNEHGQIKNWEVDLSDFEAEEE